MRGFVKFLKWGAVGLLGIPALLYGVWVIANLGDESPNPDLQRLTAASGPELAPERNAWFDLIGLGAADDQEPHAFGVTWFQQATAIDQMQMVSSAATAPTPAIAAQSRKPSVKADAIPCKEGEQCLAQVAADPEGTRRVLSEEAILLRRFDALLEREYREPFRVYQFTSPLPQYQPAVTAARLAAARFALAVHDGNDDAALDRWGRETRFFIRELEGARTLLDKMVAVSNLHRHHWLLARYFALRPAQARNHAARIAASLPPLAADARSLRTPIESEFSALVNEFLKPGFRDDPDRLFRGIVDDPLPALIRAPLLRPVATVNEAYALQSPWLRIDSLSGDAYREALTAQRAAEERFSADAGGLNLRNPIGRILLALALQDFTRYFLQRDNLLADRALLAFALERIAADATAGDSIKGALQAHGELRHPFTGEAPAWDEKTRRLAFRPAPEFQDRKLMAIELEFPAAH